MKKRIKQFTMVALGAAMAVLSTTTAFAGQWKQDSIGWWWQEDNGTYPISTWKWLDGNRDGSAECYYFDERGYMLANTITPDGYTVNGDGAWVENGVVQSKEMNSSVEAEYAAWLEARKFYGPLSLEVKYYMEKYLYSGMSMEDLYEVACQEESRKEYYVDLFLGRKKEGSEFFKDATEESLKEHSLVELDYMLQIDTYNQRNGKYTDTENHFGAGVSNNNSEGKVFHNSNGLKWHVW